MSMRPVGQPSRDQFEGAELEAYDWVVQREANRGQASEDGIINPYFGSMLHSPEMCYHISGLGKLFRLAGDRADSFSHIDREWTDQVLAVHMKSNVVMRGHLEDALARGVRVEAIKALWEGNEENLTEGERLVADYIRQVHDGRADDETYAAIEKRMGRRGAVEFTVWIEFLALTMRIIEAINPAVQATTEELLQEINEYADGTREIPKQMMYHAG